MRKIAIGSVVIDWGTTNARAYALAAPPGETGAIVEARAAPLGILNVEDGHFDAAFEELVGGWREEPDIPVLMSGMIGSRQGWIEAPYAACPAGPAAVATALTPVPGKANVFIVPGVSLSNDGRHDVMRGEEVQCFGAVALTGERDAVICLPGTHSKWVAMADGAIARFATSMTGETYAVMRRHSILGALMTGTDAEAPGAAFGTGLTRSGEAGGLLNHLFSVRADGLFEAVPSDGLADYLSGILIGHEVRAMTGMFAPSGPVLLIGGGALTARYQAAFGHLGLAVRAVDAEQATVAGLSAVQRLAAATA